MNIKAALFLGLSLPSLLCAQSIFELQFEGDSAKDVVGGRSIELVNVVVMNQGDAAYGDFDGKGAIVVEEGGELSFRPQDTLWIELWVNPVKVTASAALVSKGSGGNYKIVLQPDGLWAFSYYSRGEWHSVKADAPLAFHEWQHVACFFDSPSGMLTLLVNGKVVAHVSGCEPFQGRDETPLYIGGQRDKDGACAGINGMIGLVIVARDNLRNVPFESIVGQKVFDVAPPY